MENMNDQTMDDLSQSRTTGTTGSTAGSTNSQVSNMTDRARELTGNAQEKLADVGSNVRDRAGQMKDTLADALESGADKLRARGGAQGSGNTLAGATGGSSVAVGEDGQVAQLSNRVAGGMDATADWLREADLDGLRASVEQQVKEHPGRTLLIAAGLGYLLGKAFRK
jgi:ElaB/YqjD/DUF883 family membrane-anchored ribosome-binding protein